MEQKEDQVTVLVEAKKIEVTEKESVKKTKQQITVPFIWEEKPGEPKKDWKPKREPLATTPALAPVPVKYVAAVPFKWEEKPGTPLRSFGQEPQEPEIPETVLENKSLPLPPAYCNRYENDSDEASSYVDEYDEPDWLSELDFEAISVQTEESSSSTFSPLANHSVAKDAISSVAPLQDPFIMHNEELREEPSLPERSTSMSSQATGSTSLRGAAFLEYLFPLYPRKAGLLDKAGNSDEKVALSGRERPLLAEPKKLDQEGKSSGASRWPLILGEPTKLDQEGKRSSVSRRPLTLGELIMMSRRRSYLRKAVHMKKNNPPKDFTENKAQGCLNLGASGGGITKTFGKDLLTLKFA